MNIETFLHSLTPRLAEWSIRFTLAIIVLVGGWMLAGWASRTVRRLLNRSDKIDATVATFVASLVRYAILIIALVLVLAKVGVETTSLVAMLGAMGLAIGLALQGTLSDVAAGVVLLVVRPFRVGDLVDIAGMQGEVRSVALFTTEIATGDNRRIIIPNSKVWGQPIQNLTSYGTRRIDITLVLDTPAEPDKLLASFISMMSCDTAVLPEPKPIATIESLRNGLHITLSAWTCATDMVTTKARLHADVYTLVIAQGITLQNRPIGQTDPAHKAPA
jgi:small conductance mechanosensitive channel